MNSLRNVFAFRDILARLAVGIQEGIIDPFLVQQKVHNVNPAFCSGEV